MTDRDGTRQGPRWRATPLELRAYVAAALAVIYTVAWRAIAAQPVVHATTATASAEPPRVIWFDRLPPLERPAIAIPAGWQIASEAQPAADRSFVVRAPSRRIPRVRTRSS